MKFSKARLIGVVLLGLFVAALVGATSSEFMATGQPKELIYTMAMFSDLRRTNTMAFIRTATVWEAYVLGARHCTLYTTSPTRFYYVPSLAAELPYKPGTTELNLVTEPDKTLSLTIKLKKGVKWSDGTEITADDVVFSYNEPVRLGVEKLGGGWTWSLDPAVFVRAEKIDSHTVKLFFKEFSLRIQFASLFHSIFQKKFWEPHFKAAAGPSPPATTDRVKLEAVDSDVEPSCGWGAFPEALKKPGKGWEKGAFATNLANPHYFWKGVRVDERDARGFYVEEKPGVYKFEMPVPDVPGPPLARYETGPFIDIATYRIFADVGSAVLSLLKGEVGFLLNPLGADLGILDSYKREPKIKFQKNKSHGMFYMSFNHRLKPFGSGPLQKDPKFRDDDIIGSRFRQAMNCIVDRQFATDVLMQGVAFPMFSVVSPANSFWFNEKVTAPCAEFTEKTDPKTARAKKVDAAMKILKSAGFTWEVEPKADIKTGEVKAGRGIIMPAILKSEELKLAAGGKGEATAPAGTIAAGVKVTPFTAKVTVSLGAVDKAGKVSAPLKAGEKVTITATDAATVRVYFYGKGAKVKEFEFIYPNSAYDPRRALMGVQVEKWANQIGIPVRGVPTGFNVIVDAIFERQEFDMWSLGWMLGTVSLLAPTYLKDFFHTVHTDVGDDNAQGYSNPEVDALLEEFLVTKDLSKAREIVLRIQEILEVDSPYVTWFDTIIVDAWRDDQVVFPFTERTMGIVGLSGMPWLVKLR